jgi:hypothetical protein
MDTTTQGLFVTLKNLYDVIGAQQAEIDILAGVMGMADPNAAPQEGQQAIEQAKRDIDDLLQKLAAGNVPTRDAVIDRLLAGQIALQREHRALNDKIGVLTRLVDSHQHFIESLTTPPTVH